MTVSDLDRLVTKTEMNPISKRALRGVRSAVISGRCGIPQLREMTWSVAIDNERGTPMRMSFSLKRV